jgi:hypothetical protein
MKYVPSHTHTYTHSHVCKVYILKENWQHGILNFYISRGFLVESRKLTPDEGLRFYRSYVCNICLGGLVVSVLATGPKVRGFNPGRVRLILRVIKIRSATSFGREVKPSVPCLRFTACKRTLRAWIEMFRKQNLVAISRPSFQLFAGKFSHDNLWLRASRVTTLRNEYKRLGNVCNALLISSLIKHNVQYGS